MTAQHHLNWGAEALWERLVPLLPGLSVEVLARVDSTNTRLLERARELSGAPDGPITRPGELDRATPGPATPHGRRGADVMPCLLVAEEQLRGRGRLGRGWVSSAGASLTFSLSLPLSPADWSGLSLAVGLALAEALDPLADAGATPRIHLKWPNDLWLLDGPGQGRKLGGILIETVTVGRHRMCVVGVGLNVLPQPAPVPAASELTHGYACVQEFSPDADAPGVLALVAEPLVRGLLAFQADGFAPLVGRYTRRDLLQGRSVTTTLAEAPAGVAEGVDERGALRVRSGVLHHLVSGEVSVRLAPDAA